MKNHPFVKGTETDFARILELSKQDKWEEAIELIDSLLPLQENTDRATELLQTIISHDPQADVAKGLMHMRSVCFQQLIPIEARRVFEEQGRPFPCEGRFKMDDPRLVKLASKVKSHATICAEVFGDDPEILLYAAGACLLSGDAGKSLKLISRVLELDPSNAKAKALAVQIIKVEEQHK